MLQEATNISKTGKGEFVCVSLGMMLGFSGKSQEWVSLGQETVTGEQGRLVCSKLSLHWKVTTWQQSRTILPHLLDSSGDPILTL